MSIGPDVLDPGRYDAVVVDAVWHDEPDVTPALVLELTLTAGSHKGTVVDVAFVVGSASTAQALAALGVTRAIEGGDEAVAIDVLAMPCTLVVVRDDVGRTGYALEP